MFRPHILYRKKLLWFYGKIFFPVGSIYEFIQYLNNIHLTQNYLIANLNVASLYTSVDAQTVIIRINDYIDNMENINKNMKTILKNDLNL